MSDEKKITLEELENLLEEEQGWCWYVMCLDCGAQTAQIEFKTPRERDKAAGLAADLWNFGKIMRSGIGD